MTDHILHGFLERQRDEGLALAAESDLFALLPLDGDPPQRYVVEFHCKGLVRARSGEIVEAERFAVGIWFPDDYLRSVNPFQVLTWLAPQNVWHPNISNVAPFVCVGRLAPATGLVDVIYQLFEIVTYHKVTMREDDALNKEACAWTRRNLPRFPVDTRPLKRRSADVDFEILEVQA
jgi:hypothetical protein